MRKVHGIPKSSIFVFGLLLACTLVFCSQARAEQVADKQTCKNLMLTLATTTDTDLLSGCMDHLYFHNNEDVPAGSYNHMIAIGYRLISVDPQTEINYITVAWLLYSKWVQWKHQPTQMPDGEAKLQEALNLLEAAAKIFPTSADYFQAAGNNLAPGARYESATLVAPAAKYLMRADQLSTAKAQKIRIRLDLGHLFRHNNDKASALVWFNKVLELDPKNSVALRFIQELLAP